MTIEIPTAYQPFVQSMIASGQFKTESDVVGAALSLLSRRQRSSERLLEEIDAALDEVDRNEGTEVAYEDIGTFVQGVYREAINELQSQRPPQ